MRWVNRLALAAAGVLSAACGDYSNEDLRFLVAVPTRADLAVEVPADAAPAPGALTAQAAACANGSSETWGWAKPMSDRMNASVELLLGLVDVVRRLPPSYRADDARGWGPFPDESHPGIEIRVLLGREFPGGPDAPPRFVYVFQARDTGAADWTAVLWGAFDGASATHGTGGLVLDFDALWALGMADADAPHGKMYVEYDRSPASLAQLPDAPARRIRLFLDQSGLGLESVFGYEFRGWPDGSGTFGYAFRQSGDLLMVQASFDAAGQGRAAVGFRTAGGLEGGYQQCWDADACLVYVLDAYGYSCGGGACNVGDVAACAVVPSPPF